MLIFSTFFSLKKKKQTVESPIILDIFYKQAHMEITHYIRLIANEKTYTGSVCMYAQNIYL